MHHTCLNVFFLLFLATDCIPHFFFLQSLQARRVQTKIHISSLKREGREVFDSTGKRDLHIMSSVQLFCIEGDYESVEATLNALKGVESIASLPNKKGRSVFVKFQSEELAAAAQESLKENPKVTLPGQGKKTAAAAADGISAAKKKKSSNNAVADFFTYQPYSGGKKETRSNEQEEHAQGADDQNRQPRHRGRGGARGGGSGRGGGSRGGFRGGSRGPRVPMIQGFVAVLDNVPFSTTNDQIAKLFATSGGIIYDINRLENMAMVYFNTPEAVQQAILLMNGKKIQNNVITVSSGGHVKVPAPMAPPADVVAPHTPTPHGAVHPL